MILIIGVDGLLGNFLFEKFKLKSNVIGTSRKRFSINIIQYDILKPLSDLVIEWEKIESVIITAACSNVGFCELNPYLSNEINYVAITKIIKFLKTKNIPVVIFSSEYVFDGQYGGYTEFSKKSPNTHYGLQKSRLEDYVINFYPKSTIFRISKLFSISNTNSFVFKMINEINNNNFYNAAVDQFFTPINLDDCFKIILYAISFQKYGVFNLCGNDNYSRYSLAIKLKNSLKLNGKINKCFISDISLNYKIPLNLTMSCEKIKKEFQINPNPLKFI